MKKIINTLAILLVFVSFNLKARINMCNYDDYCVEKGEDSGHHIVININGRKCTIFIPKDSKLLLIKDNLYWPRINIYRIKAFILYNSEIIPFTQIEDIIYVVNDGLLGSASYFIIKHGYSFSKVDILGIVIDF